MARFDERWCDSLEAAVGQSSDFANGELTKVLYVVTDTADGKVAFNLVDDGASLTVGIGKFPRGVKPDITITAKESVLLQLWSGDRTRDEAFMVGDLKVEGAYARWLDDLVPAFADAPWADAWAGAV